MNKKKAIPENFMTVGELAKKMGTTVRTLQYYDKEGLLSPTTERAPLKNCFCIQYIVTQNI